MKRSNLISFFQALTIAVGASHVYGQIDTQKRTIDDSFQAGYWIHTVDFDFDGDPDIVAASIKSGLKWYENDGTGAFTKHNISETFLEAWTIHANDIDGDGDMDVVAASALPKEVAWFRNNGDDTFTKRTVEEDYFETHGVFSADLDNDGDIDLMAAVWESRDVVWWENNGSQNFTRRILDGDFNSPHAIRAADLDGDGNLDIIASGGGKTAWWENNANGSFTKHQLGSFGAFSVFPVDLDGDNDLDILRNQRNNGDVDWFENDNATFTEQTIAADLGESWSQVAGDLDLDGDLDVVVAEYVPDRITYWLNDGDQNFSEVVLDNGVTRPRCVNLADYDGDGDLDIAAVLTKNTKIVWYEVLGSPELSLTVTRPNGGEVLEGGSTFLLEWASTGEIPDVKLEYSPDGGQAWTDIIASTPNSGSLFWIVPTAETGSALVRISDVADPAVTDESDSLFSIIVSTLTLAAPNGGESWTGGDSQTIEWSSTGAVNNVQIEV
ncbi:MAG: VCBS repeat-containing protein, partial [Calditrichaeota bacterium]|nr:VCBS repeat-containing protein [Calditrichota bacterium]